jgi:Phage-related minor tail protein
MAEVTTALKVTATADNTIQKTFRDIAAQVETMSARVTRSQRTMVAEHKAAANVFVQSAQMVQTSIGKISGAFGVGLGIGAIVEAGKKAVTVFATVDEQARALAVSTKRTEEEIAGFYERVKQVAGAAAIDADTLRNSFDDLARAIGPEAAAAALPRLAMAAKAMKAPIADVVGLMEQMNDNLGISADQAPAAFDMIQKGTEGTRTTAAGATKGLADLSLQMRGLGENGEKGLRSTLGLLVAIGKHAPSTEAAVASLQSLMDKVGTRKTEESLEKLGHVPMRAALDEAKRKHQDEFLVFLNEVDRALTNMATERGTPIAAKMQYLQTLIKSPEDRQAIQSILEGMPEYRAIRDRTAAQEAGATEQAFKTMRPSAASFLTKLGNAGAELLEAGGRALWGAPGTLQHQSTEAEKRPDLAAKGLLPGQSPTGGATLNGMIGGAKKTSWWDWLNPISPAGAAEAPGGPVGPWRGSRRLAGRGNAGGAWRLGPQAKPPGDPGDERSRSIIGRRWTQAELARRGICGKPENYRRASHKKPKGNLGFFERQRPLGRGGGCDCR